MLKLTLRREKAGWQDIIIEHAGERFVISVDAVRVGQRQLGRHDEISLRTNAPRSVGIYRRPHGEEL